MKGISDQDYEHAQQVWNRVTLGHKNITLEDYHDVYLKANVLLWANLFEAFRNTCLKHFKLGPAHFYTAPGLAWQALLKAAAVYCEHEKGVRTANYASTSFGLSFLQT